MIIIVDQLSFLIMVFCNALYFEAVFRIPWLGLLDKLLWKMFDRVA